MARSTVKVVALLGLTVLTATLFGCTAEQRAWCHDNIPVLGMLFSPLVPVPTPLWKVFLDGIASLFVDHPVETGGALAAVGGVVAKNAHSGIPGLATEWRKVNLEHPTATRKAKRAILARRRVAAKRAKLDQQAKDAADKAKLDALEAQKVADHAASE